MFLIHYENTLKYKLMFFSDQYHLSMSTKNTGKLSLSITPEERADIKKLFGYGYIKKIKARFDKKGYTTLSGSSYSLEHITYGLTDKNKDQRVTDFIFAVTADKRKEIEKIKAKRNEILTDV